MNTSLEKYLKYKSKYLELQKELHGGVKKTSPTGARAPASPTRAPASSTRVRASPTRAPASPTRVPVSTALVPVQTALVPASTASTGRRSSSPTGRRSSSPTGIPSSPAGRSWSSTTSTDSPVDIDQATTTSDYAGKVDSEKDDIKKNIQDLLLNKDEMMTHLNNIEKEMNDLKNQLKKPLQQKPSPQIQGNIIEIMRKILTYVRSRNTADAELQLEMLKVKYPDSKEIPNLENHIARIKK